MSKCNVYGERRKFYYEKVRSSEDFDIDQTVLASKQLFDHLYGDKGDPPPNLAFEWYPNANAYYQFTEDVDAFARVNHLLATKPSFLSMSSLEQIHDELDEYSEKSVQLRYLESNPVCFVIFGKPDIGECELGKRLAEYWRCEYLDPEVLIEQEISLGTRAGQCIEYNLRCGRAIGIDVILKLLEKRVKSDTVKHRGFVLCGLPLIPNDLYEEDPVSSESAVFTAEEMFEEMMDKLEVLLPEKPRASMSSKVDSQASSVVGEEEEAKVSEVEDEFEEDQPKKIKKKKKKEFLEPPLDVGSVNYNIIGSQPIGTNYEEQLNLLFQFLKQPFMIIYVSCGAIDAISKRGDYLFDIYSKRVIDMQRQKTMMNYYTHIPVLGEEGVPDELLEIDLVDAANYKHLVKLPRDFPTNVSSQLDRYHYSAMNWIEQRVLTHDPQMFVKVDGRTAPSKMFQIVKAKLDTLPLQRVVIPTRVQVQSAEGEVGEDVQDFTIDQLFKKDLPGEQFKWSFSDFKEFCPVSMKSGLYLKGETQFAVQFLNKIFFLANRDAFISFYRNPRPFLMPPLPKPSCRIMIFGQIMTGKSAIAQCLAYLLNGFVMSPADMCRTFLEKKEQEHKSIVYQTALFDAINILNEKRKIEAIEKEKERLVLIEDWMRTVRGFLVEYKRLEEEKALQEGTGMSSFPMPLMDMKEKFNEQNYFQKVRDDLASVNIPYEVDVKPLLDMAEHRLRKFIPPHLAHRIVAKPASVLDPFVIKYAEDAVKATDFESMANISDYDLQDIFRTELLAIEEKFFEQENHRGGWVIDGMPLNLELMEFLWNEFPPDDVFVIVAKKSDYLKSKVSGRFSQKFRDFKQFFIDIGRGDIAWKCPEVVSTESLKQNLIKDILYDVVFESVKKAEMAKGSEPAKIDNRRETLINMTEKFESFQVQFPPINSFLLSKNIIPIEVSIDDKSIREVLKEAIDLLQGKYCQSPTVLTEVDRAEEVKAFGDKMLEQNNTEGEGDSPKLSDNEAFHKSRHYGDTSFYCPVALKENKVLWRGKEDFAVKYQNKIYLLNSESDMNRFIMNPKDYLVLNGPAEIPPPRICILGLWGTNRDVLTKALAYNLGVGYYNYRDLLKVSLKFTGSERFDEILQNPKYEDTKIYKYLNDNMALDEVKGICKQLWCELPAKDHGFAIKDFPKRLGDAEEMISQKYIPDLVVHLTCNSLKLRKGLLKKMTAEWMKKKVNVDGERAKSFEEDMQVWKKNREARYLELMDERRERRYAQKISSIKGEMEGEDDDIDIEGKSQISFDSVAEQEDIDNVNQILDMEMPMPVLESSDDSNQIKEFQKVIEYAHNFELEQITMIKAFLEKENVKWIDINTNLDVERAKKKLFIETDFILRRNESLFESCFDVNHSVAERLLNSGYYFLSKFGRTCPVQVYDNQMPIQMYSPGKADKKLFPIVHRYYVYFVYGTEAKERFKENPLKFVWRKSGKFSLVPLRVSIIGPPKCGKTSVATRFAKDLGFKLVTRGQAIRSVLKNLPCCELALNMETVLRRGWELTDEMVMRSVEAACFDPQAATQGIVFDGFPNTITEVRHLSYLGLLPNLAIDIHCQEEQIFQCLKVFKVPREGIPRFSERFMKHILDEFKVISTPFRSWYQREYQVIKTLDFKSSSWLSWTVAKDMFIVAAKSIKYYREHVLEDLVLPLEYMLISPLEFLERETELYKAYCPCCLHYSKALEFGGNPPDRITLVQYQKYFYWICPEHYRKFLVNPEAYLPPYNNNKLPALLPENVVLFEVPENVYEDGYCCVCYTNGGEIVQGTLQYAAEHMGKIYMFESRECMGEFLKAPNMFQVEFIFKKQVDFGYIGAETLPTLGYLEQYVARDVTQALQQIVKMRPVVPGLDMQQSALVGIGLELKLGNRRLGVEFVKAYRDGYKRFKERIAFLTRYLDDMKSIINPYLYYEEPLPRFVTPAASFIASESTESMASKESMVRKMLDGILDGIYYD